MAVHRRGVDRDKDDGVIILAPRGVSLRDAGLAEEPFPTSATEGGDRGSFGSPQPLSLVQHSNDVRDLAASFARQAGLSASVAKDVALAAFLHDVGKADIRFQRYLAGSRWTPVTEVLAKSGSPRSTSEDKQLRARVALPQAWRHEALSVRIALQHPAFAEAHDPELVLWLIGTHHGYGRPFFPHDDALDDEKRTLKGFEPFVDEALLLEPGPGPQRSDFVFASVGPDGNRYTDWTGIMDSLAERYGVWGLARLEAIVRLADHRASEASVVRGGAVA